MGQKFDKRQNYGMYEIEAVIQGDGLLEWCLTVLALLIFAGGLGFF